MRLQRKPCPTRSARSSIILMQQPICASMVSYCRCNVQFRMSSFSGMAACRPRRMANARLGAMQPLTMANQYAFLPVDRNARTNSARQPARLAWSSTKGISAAIIPPTCSPSAGLDIHMMKRSNYVHQTHPSRQAVPTSPHLSRPVQRRLLRRTAQAIKPKRPVIPTQLAGGTITVPCLVGIAPISR